MADSRYPLHHANAPIEDRFLNWVDALVDTRSLPATGSPPSPDPDFAEIARTASAVQQAAGPTMSLPNDQSEAMWKDIMNTTTVSPTISPVLPGSDNAPPSGLGRPVAAPQPGWRSYLTTAVLIAAILVAGIATIWRIADPQVGNDPGPAHQPGVAGPATPDRERAAVLDAQEITPLEASPSATPVSETAGCDLTQDIPVHVDLAEPLWDRPSLLLNDGTLTLHCKQRQSVVSQNTIDIRGTGWPGSILLTMEDGTLRGVNLLTGATANLGPEAVLTENVSDRETLSYAPGAPWLGMPANQEMTDWRFVDLRTMESMLLSDEIGGLLPRSTVTSLYAVTPDAVVIGFPGVPAGSAPPSDPFDRGGATPPAGAATSNLPSENAALVIDGSLENHRWTEITRPMRDTAAISPDGELLAVVETTETDPTVRVERVDDGEVVADTGIDYGAGDTMLLLDDGAGLLHLTGERLDLITWDADIGTETLLEFEAVEGQAIMVQTADPEIAIVSLMNSIGASEGYLVNTGTDEITEVPGMLQLAFQPDYYEGVPPLYVLVASPAEDNAFQTTLQMADVTTGEVAVQSEPVAFDPGQVAMRISVLRDNGTVGVSLYQPGRAMVLNANTGVAFEVVAPSNVSGVPEGHEWYFYPVPGGSFISAAPGDTGQPSYFIRELTPDAEWVEVTPDTLLGIIPGAHALPETSD